MTNKYLPDDSEDTVNWRAVGTLLVAAVAMIACAWTGAHVVHYASTWF